jgi:glucose/arabinose dehydrogenase
MAQKLLLATGCAALLAMAGCAQAPVANHAAARTSPESTQAAPPPTPTAAPATPVPTPVPPTPAPTPPPATIALAFGPGSVTVAVTGIATGAHQVHVHRDCTGDPNLHITTLGNVFVNSDGAGSAPFQLAASLRDHGYDLLVYPLGASQGPPSLCAAI